VSVCWSHCCAVQEWLNLSAWLSAFKTQEIICILKIGRHLQYVSSCERHIVWENVVKSTVRVSVSGVHLKSVRY